MTKGLRILVLIMVLVFGFSVSSSYAEEAKKAEESKVTGSAAVGAFNRYIFRGYDLSSKSVVVQPAVTVSYKGFSAGFWGNIDTNEHTTQSFAGSPNRLGKKSFNETDLTLSYTYSIDKVSLTGGYIYYATKYAPETEELFFSAAYDVISKPTLTIYRDITSFPGTYINLSLSHSEKIYKDVTLDLGASAGYFAGSDNYWKTYQSSTAAYTGKKYSAFHDGMLKAGFTIPIAKDLTIQPVAQYWFPLSRDAKKSVSGNSYNPNGKLDETLMTGINLTFSF